MENKRGRSPSPDRFKMKDEWNHALRNGPNKRTKIPPLQFNDVDKEQLRLLFESSFELIPIEVHMGENASFTANVWWSSSSAISRCIFQLELEIILSNYQDIDCNFKFREFDASGKITRETIKFFEDGGFEMFDDARSIEIPPGACYSVIALLKTMNNKHPEFNSTFSTVKHRLNHFCTTLINSTNGSIPSIQTRPPLTLLHLPF